MHTSRSLVAAAALMALACDDGSNTVEMSSGTQASLNAKLKGDYAGSSQRVCIVSNMEFGPGGSIPAGAIVTRTLGKQTENRHFNGDGTGSLVVYTMQLNLSVDGSSAVPVPWNLTKAEGKILYDVRPDNTLTMTGTDLQVTVLSGSGLGNAITITDVTNDFEIAQGGSVVIPSVPSSDSPGIEKIEQKKPNGDPLPTTWRMCTRTGFFFRK